MMKPGMRHIYCTLYGPTTIRLILEAKHKKRALEAHRKTVQAMFDLYV